MITQTPNYARELLLVPHRLDTTTSSWTSKVFSAIGNCARTLLQSNDSAAQELYNSLIHTPVSASEIREYSSRIVPCLTEKYSTSKMTPSQVSASKIRQYSSRIIHCLTEKCSTSKMNPQELANISHIVREAFGQTITSPDALTTQTALWKLYATVTTRTLKAHPIPMYIPPEEKIRELITSISENFRSVFPSPPTTELFIHLPTELCTHLASWLEDVQTDIVIAYSRSPHKSDVVELVQALNEFGVTLPEKAALFSQIVQYMQKKPWPIVFRQKSLIKSLLKIAPKEWEEILVHLAKHFPKCYMPCLMIDALSAIPHQNRKRIIELTGKLANDLDNHPPPYRGYPTKVGGIFAIKAVSKVPHSEQVSLFADWCQLALNVEEYRVSTDPVIIELLSQVPADRRRARITLLLEASRQAKHLPHIKICSYLIAHCISEATTSQEELCKLLRTIPKHCREDLPKIIVSSPQKSRIQILIQFFSNSS